MNKRHYEHTLPNIRGSLSNTYGCLDVAEAPKADRICLSPLPSPFLDFTQSRSLRVTMRNPETGTVTPLKGWVGNM